MRHRGLPRPGRWRRGPIVATLAPARLRRASGANISPGPYRSFRELSLAGSVDPDIWCPPTFVGNSGIECFNGDRGLALSFSNASFPRASTAMTIEHDRMPAALSKGDLRKTALDARDAMAAAARAAASEKLAARGLPFEIPSGAVVSGYSAIRSELDPVPLMQKLVAQGASLALPAVLARGKSLAFRAWSLGDRL